MKQVMDRTLYDTETAEQIATYAPLTDRGDFNYLIERLYRTQAGEYFLHAEGGAGTKWAEKISNISKPRETLELLTEEEALDWCEEREINGDIILEELGHLIEKPAAEE